MIQSIIKDEVAAYGNSFDHLSESERSLIEGSFREGMIRAVMIMAEESLRGGINFDFVLSLSVND